MRLECKVSVSVDVVWGVLQSSVLGLFMFTLYTSELFHFVGNHIMRYVDDTTLYDLFLTAFVPSSDVGIW